MRSEPPSGGHLPLEWGVRAGTTDPSGVINVTHGLGETPAAVWLQTGNAHRATLNGSPTASTITVRVLDAAGSPVAGTSVTIYWMAVTS